MATIINASIDVTKIPKESLIKGKKGTYANVTVFINDETRFGNNASIAMSMSKEEIVLPKDIIDAKTICYDLFYSKTRTAFQSWAYDNGAKICHDGLGMLIQQAKHSFVIWNDLIPDVNNLEEKLREL